MDYELRCKVLNPDLDPQELPEEKIPGFILDLFETEKNLQSVQVNVGEDRYVVLRGPRKPAIVLTGQADPLMYPGAARDARDYAEGCMDKSFPEDRVNCLHEYILSLCFEMAELQEPGATVVDYLEVLTEQAKEMLG
jgi:hypothetical protein